LASKLAADAARFVEIHVCGPLGETLDFRFGWKPVEAD
jgi:hypothetical protein